MAARVIGATDRSLDRQLSIFDFAVRHRLGPGDYRVLDDQAELLEELEGVVIAYDRHHGLANYSENAKLACEQNGPMG